MFRFCFTSYFLASNLLKKFVVLIKLLRLGMGMKMEPPVSGDDSIILGATYPHATNNF